eukprot:TRINITY_DN1316_c0_g1_i2.p1 TRINITY_DN1316_c0_g1~~TRINITY_DN1316_c0_g1_i2.p1  ORF type:complete len:1135 (+),score=347.88 TRINITY_DN1316_c0_g1_i2:65-3469(+)
MSETKEPEKPTQEEETSKSEDSNVLSTLDHIRLKVSTVQSDAFAALGGAIARDPLPFIAVPWLLMIAFAWGIYNVHIEVNPVKLWVQEGSRLEGEDDFYTSIFGDLTRSIGIQTVPKDHLDAQYQDGNMMTTAHMAENYDIDGAILDMRPSRNPFLEILGGCAGLNQSTCDDTTKPLCGWDLETGVCMYQDQMGIMPSNQQKSAYTFNYLGVDWGWRELCVEVKAPVDPKNGVQTSRLSAARAPCSKLQTPMDCFAEHPRSQQTGVLALLGWARNHPVSYTDQAAYNATLTAPCAVWQGTYNSKGYTIGGPRYGTDGLINHVSSYKMLYPVNTADDFADHYNNYIMKHETSAQFYRQFGFPETITEEQAFDIIEGWESGFDQLMPTVNNKMHLSEISWLSQWHVLDIVKDASVKNQTYVIIGLVLLLVVVWGFLFRLDFVSSRLLLGLYGVMTVAMAIIGTLGFTALCEVDFNILTLQVLPYVGMGLGIDDMFVLLHYFDEDTSVSVTHRMKQCFAHAGPSVCATTTINAFVFFLGASIPVKAVIDFAIQSGVNVVFNFVMVLFAFGGMLAIDARRVRNGRYDVVPCMVREHAGEPKKTHLSKVATELLMKPVVTKFSGQAIGLAITLGVFGVGVYGAHKITLGLPLREFIENDSQHKTYLDIRHDYYTTQINYIVGRGGDWHTRENQIKLNTVINKDLANKVNAFGINGTLDYAEPTFLIQGAAWTQVFRAYALQYPGAQDPNNSCECYPAYLSNPTVPPFPWYSPLFFRNFPVDCTINPDMYYDLLALLLGEKTCLENGTVPAINFKDPKYFPTCPNGVGSPPHNIQPITCQQVESSVATFGDIFKALGTSAFAKVSYGYGAIASYGDQVQLTMEAQNTNPRIRGWNLPVANSPIEQADVENTLKAMAETRDLLDKTGLPIFAWGQSYLYAEQYRFTRENLRTMLIIAVCGSFILTAVLMASASLALIQTIVIGMSVTTIVGCVRMLDLELNGVSMLSLAFGVGINVELCVHICRAFLVTRPTDPLMRRGDQQRERIMYALSEMSIPVFDGAFTSFMAVIVLSFNETPFFKKYFFYLYSVMIAVSLFYAFVPLPILLCLFGPSPLPAAATHDLPSTEPTHEEDEALEKKEVN